MKLTGQENYDGKMTLHYGNYTQTSLCSLDSLNHALHNLSLMFSGEEQHCTVAAVREADAD